MNLPHKSKIEHLIKSLWPVKTQYPLVRIGGINDGGYLIPDVLGGVAACFSPGVSNICSFEDDLFHRSGVPSYLADYSVSQAPPSLAPNTFIKKFIGTVNDNVHVTLESWVRNSKEFASCQDLILQMDIEGGEIPSILSTPDEILKRFRIILMEIHNVQSWKNEEFFNIVESFFKKLLQHFHVVHNHPNNCCGLVDLDGVLSPRVFELTLLRKDWSPIPHTRRGFHIFWIGQILPIAMTYYFHPNGIAPLNRAYLNCL